MDKNLFKPSNPNYFPCAGFIVFTKDLKKTLLVKTHKGHYGFPKGKKELGEMKSDCAYRELNEETGLSKDSIEIIEGLTVKEYSDKGNPSVHYFVAYISKFTKDFTFDKEELAEVGWYKCNQVVNMDIKKNRAQLLKTVLDELSNKK